MVSEMEQSQEKKDADAMEKPAPSKHPIEPVIARRWSRVHSRNGRWSRRS